MKGTVERIEGRVGLSNEFVEFQAQGNGIYQKTARYIVQKDFHGFWYLFEDKNGNIRTKDYFDPDKKHLAVAEAERMANEYAGIAKGTNPGPGSMPVVDSDVLKFAFLQ